MDFLRQVFLFGTFPFIIKNIWNRVPREYYPIYAEVDESGFVCDSQVDEADRDGGLDKVQPPMS